MKAPQMSESRLAREPMGQLSQLQSYLCMVQRNFLNSILGPGSRAFRERSVAASDGIMLSNVFSTANFKTRDFPAYPTDSNSHDRLDDTGGSGIPHAWMARSPALLAFGGDSAIELLSAIGAL